MPAYVIAMMAIQDPDTYRKYTDRTPPTVKRYGGKFLTRGEPVTTIEGKVYTDRLVILEFPSKAHVEAWFADPDYQEAMVFRHASSVMRMLLVQEGGDNTEDPTPNL
ncbi:MAG: DUF1330 domain-containing protein [Anaerolineae bacterium]|jgi:uncharacterized protein (DUF1330 family)